MGAGACAPTIKPACVWAERDRAPARERADRTAENREALPPEQAVAAPVAEVDRDRLCVAATNQAARRRERDRELPRALCARFLPVTGRDERERELRLLFPRALAERSERGLEVRELVALRVPDRARFPSDRDRLPRRELARAEEAERLLLLLCRPCSRPAAGFARRDVFLPLALPAAVSRPMILLKLLCSPPAVSSSTSSARLFSSNFCSHSSHSMGSSEVSPL